MTKVPLQPFDATKWGKHRRERWRRSCHSSKSLLPLQAWGQKEGMQLASRLLEPKQDLQSHQDVLQTPHPGLFRTGSHFSVCAKTVTTPGRSLRTNERAAELRRHIKPCSYSSRGESAALCFLAQRDVLWYFVCGCLRRRSLCRRVMGFTHDDKAERSDPTIV